MRGRLRIERGIAENHRLHSAALERASLDAAGFPWVQKARG